MQENILEADAVKIAGTPQFDNDPGFIIDDQIIRDDAVLETQEHQINPIGGNDLTNRFVNANDYVEFQYMNGSDVYVPNKIYANLQIETYLAQGEPASDARTYLMSNIKHLFSRMELQTGSDIDRVEYPGIIDTVLKVMYCNNDYIKSVGTLNGFYPNESQDASNAGDEDLANGVVDPQAVKRSARMGPLNGGLAATHVTANFILDFPFKLFQCQKYVKGLTWTMRLYRNSLSAMYERIIRNDQGALGGNIAGIPANGLTITVKSLTLHVPTLRVEAGKLAQFDSMITKEYLLQTTGVHLVTQPINSGITQFKQVAATLKSMPSKCYVCFQREQRQTKTSVEVTATLQAAGAAAVNAKYALARKLNPLTFDHMNIDNIYLTVNNKAIKPFNAPNRISWTANSIDYARTLKNTLSACGTYNDYTGGSFLTYENFINYPIFGFDFKGNTTGNGLPEINKEATQIEASVTWAGNAPLQEPYRMYMIFVFDEVLSVAGVDTNIIRTIFGH